MPVFIEDESLDENERLHPALNYLPRKRKFLAALDPVPAQNSDTEHYETTPFPVRSDDVYVPRTNRFYNSLAD